MVRRPAGEVYARLTAFEEMPAYLDGVASVRRVSDDVLRVRPERGGPGAWDVRITVSEPGRCLSVEPLDPTRPGVRFLLEPGTGTTGVTVRVSAPAADPDDMHFAPDPERLRAHLES